jgi:hypothetical protein
MTHTALLKVAPIHTLKRHNDPTWNREGRTLYSSNSLRFLPYLQTVPLLVDHDEDQEIGYIHDIIRLSEADGPWLLGRAVITAAPSWLKSGTPASLCSKILDHSRFHEPLAPSLRAHDLVYSAIVTEMSILSPGVKPAEPLAKVVLLQRSTATPEPHPSPGDVVIYGDGTIIRRRGIGQVLGVR